MSVSSLPGWKQLLLERKRREEKQRERREKEEEEKLASMPAWKRGIIQRRKAKQENVGDRERDKDISPQPVDPRSPSDALSDTDSSVTVNLGSDPSLSPDPGQWLDAEPKLVSQVSVETIVPVHENPFIRTQSAWRKGREAEITSEPDVKEKPSPAQDVETARGRDIELKIERFRDLSQGWDKEKSRDRSLGRERENNREGPEKVTKQQRESVKDAAREQDKEILPLSGPCLRTIRADNIIIIEQDRGGCDEQRGFQEEDQQGKRGMKMDLREILAGGGSVTEIRASEVLIIKPLAGPEERTQGGKGREDGDMKSSMESLGRQLRSDVSWLRENEKERPWGQATVINKDDTKDMSDDCVFVERGGRVSQLLSKFGQHPKPPSRSKSSDNFLQPGWRKYSEDQDEQSEQRKNMALKGVPKRSFSFSDRVVGAVENGDERSHERIRSERSVAQWVDVTATAQIRTGCARLFDKERVVKQRDVKTEEDLGGAMHEKEADVWTKHRSELKKVDSAAEKVGDADGDRGFTVASVKNTEGISFARRVPIRQDGRARADGGTRRLTSLEKDSEPVRQIEAQVGGKVLREDERKTLPDGRDVDVASGELLSPRDARHGQGLACTECSSFLCTVTDRVHQRGLERSGTGPQGPYVTQSVLSQQTENLISKIEKLGDTTVYMNERGERVYKAAPEMKNEEAQTESPTHEVTPRSPRRIAPTGTPQGPLEIQVPRSVFYVAEDASETTKSECQSSDGRGCEEGQKVERRDSWRIGKPPSRIESLREKIRQRELEKRMQREARDGDGGEAAEIRDAPTGEDRREQSARQTEKEREAAARVQARPTGAETVQEEAAEQTPTTERDVRQEVDVLKSYPQLPVSVPRSQDDSGEEVTGELASAASEVIADSSQIPEDEDNPLKYVAGHLGCHRDRYESTEEEEEDEKELSEEEVGNYTTAINSTQPSPPLPSSLAAMSRIYNLNNVGSRSALCLRDRTVDAPSSLHLVKVKPLISNSQQGDGKTPQTADNVCGVQRQIEQFQLKEQESQKSCANTLKDGETKGPQSLKGVSTHTEEQKPPELNLKASPPQAACSPTSPLRQTVAVTPSFVRSRSPDNSLKPTNCAPTPASSPSSPSPANSPSISPSPSASPKLFTVRSASGGHVKRGATITVTPKKTAAGGIVASVSRPTVAESKKGPSHQTSPAVDEPVKKKYPTAQEIEVIGGYQNLEKSCLVKNKVAPKRVSCFCLSLSRDS